MLILILRLPGFVKIRLDNVGSSYCSFDCIYLAVGFFERSSHLSSRAIIIRRIFQNIVISWPKTSKPSDQLAVLKDQVLEYSINKYSTPTVDLA